MVGANLRNPLASCENVNTPFRRKNGDTYKKTITTKINKQKQIITYIKTKKSKNETKKTQ